MEKETMDHGKMCGWCGQDKGIFSKKRLLLAVLIGLFIFLAGIRIGEMRAQFGGYEGRHHMMGQRVEFYGNRDDMMDDQDMMPGQNVMMLQGTTTAPAAPAAPAVPAPAQQ